MAGFLGRTVLHLAVWQMLALMCTHREGSFTDCLIRGFSGPGCGSGEERGLKTAGQEPTELWL